MSRYGIVTLVAAALLVGACAVPRSGRPPANVDGVNEARKRPMDRVEAKRRLAGYIAQLERGRVALGFDAPRDDGDDAYRPSAVPLGATARARAEQCPAANASMRAARRSPKKSHCAAKSAPSPSPTTSSDYSEGESLGAASALSCPMICKHARAICHAAEHICRLADYLNEADARTRCLQARDDCDRAKERTRGQCASCPRDAR